MNLYLNCFTINYRVYIIVLQNLKIKSNYIHSFNSEIIIIQPDFRPNNS